MSGGELHLEGSDQLDFDKMLPWRSVSAQNIDLSALLVSCKFPRNIILKYNCIENLWGSLLGDASASKTMFQFQVDSKENTIPMSQWFKDNILQFNFIQPLK